MMRARQRAVDTLERAASHDWRRLVAGAVSVALVVGGEFFLLARPGAQSRRRVAHAGVPAALRAAGTGVVGGSG